MTSIALIPLRAQPLHLGHCNLLVDVCQRYERVIILLSSRVGDSRNPYSYEQRFSWLETARDRYDISYEIAPLPSFSSSSRQTKSTEEIHAIQVSFETLVGSSDFVIISGNADVIRAARDVYDFAALLIGDDYLPARHLGEAPVFGAQLAGNSEMIRQWLANTHQHSQTIATHLPTWVYDDLVNGHTSHPKHHQSRIIQ